ncbi:MAG: hypothetical protein IJW00_02345 [Clostridia bacterium]|nr:hypothetical protein [Clostridia bacterium]
MKNKKIIILLICSAVLFVGLCAAIYIPSVINNLSVEQRVSGFLDPYRTAAVEYVTAHQEAIARFGKEALSECTVVSITYRYANDQYKSALFFLKAPETADEFNDNVEYIGVSVKINYSTKCTVQFEKDETGKMVIVGHEWED